jgi:hypothetical protein
LQEAGSPGGVDQAAAALILASQMAWYAPHSLVASETTLGDTQSDGALPLGRRLAHPRPGDRVVLPPDGTAGRPVVAADGGWCGVYLFCMDVLYDLQHHIWSKGANGVVELVTNPVALAPSALVPRWTWVRRAALGDR